MEHQNPEVVHPVNHPVRIKIEESEVEVQELEVPEEVINPIDK